MALDRYNLRWLEVSDMFGSCAMGSEGRESIGVSVFRVPAMQLEYLRPAALHGCFNPGEERKGGRVEVR